jgi:hypothetical protein
MVRRPRVRQRPGMLLGVVGAVVALTCLATAQGYDQLPARRVSRTAPISLVSTSSGTKLPLALPTRVATRTAGRQTAVRIATPAAVPSRGDWILLRGVADGSGSLNYSITAQLVEPDRSAVLGVGLAEETKHGWIDAHVIDRAEVGFSASVHGQSISYYQAAAVRAGRTASPLRVQLGRFRKAASFGCSLSPPATPFRTSTWIWLEAPVRSRLARAA